MLVADPRVDLDTTDRQGRSLEEVGGWVFLLPFDKLAIFLWNLFPERDCSP